MKKEYDKKKKLVIFILTAVAVCLAGGLCFYLVKIGTPKEFKKTPQPKTVGELDAVWRGVEDGRKFDPSNKLEEKKQEA